MVEAAGVESRIQNFFVRELAEVYLLLDNVSASSSKSLSARATGPTPDDAEAIKHKTRDIVAPGSDAEVAAWIKRICEVGWPPEGTKSEQASQAATLILAKDYLNAMAAPATGATIAFTLLVAGEDNPYEKREENRLEAFRKRFLERFLEAGGKGGGGRRDGGGDGGHWDEVAPSRTSLAWLAYPGLVKSATRFRRRVLTLLCLLVIWLVVTCLLSWDVAVGNGLLTQYKDLDVERVAIEKQKIDADTSRDKNPHQTSPASESSGPAAPATAGFLRFCDRVGELGTKMVNNQAVPLFHDAAEQRICDQEADNKVRLEQARTNLMEWESVWSVRLYYLNPFRWPGEVWRTGADVLTLGKGAPRPHTTLALNPQWAAVFLNVLSGSVLPICYGLLGAGAAMVRGLSAKMRESLLSPRDFTLALIQLSLGAVIGACIGLFAAPPGGATGTGGLLATVPLSASALCFIAGFGVDGVFLALEGLMSRVFGVKDPTRKTT